MRLPGEHLLGKGFFAQQDAVQLDPFHPCQRAALVARTLNQHRNAEPFQLLLHLRGVVDHGIFHRKAAFCGQDALIVRGAVLARVDNAPGLHGLLSLVQIPALGTGAGKGNAVQRVQMKEQVHGRGGHQIDVLHRLLQNSHALWYGAQSGGALRPDKKLCLCVRDGQQGRAVCIAVGGELGGVVQRVGVVKHQLVRIGGCSGRGCAACKHQRGGRQSL